MQVVNTKTQTTTKTKPTTSMLFEDEDDLGKFAETIIRPLSFEFVRRCLTLLHVHRIKFQTSLLSLRSTLLRLSSRVHMQWSLLICSMPSSCPERFIDLFSSIFQIQSTRIQLRLQSTVLSQWISLFIQFHGEDAPDLHRSSVRWRKSPTESTTTFILRWPLERYDVSRFTGWLFYQNSHPVTHEIIIADGRCRKTSSDCIGG